MTTPNSSPVSEASIRGSVVALCTPLAALVASWLAAYVGNIVPGVHLDPTQIVAFMIAVVTAVLGSALKWLRGWQAHEMRVSEGIATPVKKVKSAEQYENDGPRHNNVRGTTTVPRSELATVGDAVSMADASRV